MMQPGPPGSADPAHKYDNDQDISAVSVLDDDGASGVGAAAAAAVSVALARSWAAAASQKQAAMVERTTSGSLKPGRAGFRLVAAVSNTDLVRLGGSNKRITIEQEVRVAACCIMPHGRLSLSIIPALPYSLHSIVHNHIFQPCTMIYRNLFQPCTIRGARCIYQFIPAKTCQNAQKTSLLVLKMPLSCKFCVSAR